MRRPLSLLTAILALGALGAATVPATPPGAPEPDRPAAAGTTLRLVDLGLDGPLSAPVHLGDLSTSSQRDGTTLAHLAVTGATIGRHAVGRVESRAQDGERDRDDLVLPFPDVPGLLAQLRLGSYDVRTGERDASTSVEDVAGRLGLGPLTIGVGSGHPAIATSVGDASTSQTSLVFPELGLRLGDLLPPGLVDVLPLGVTLDVLALLPQPPTSVAPVVSDLEALIADLRELTAAAGDLRAARTRLRELVGATPAVTAAEDAVAAAQSAVTAATAELSGARSDRDAAEQAVADATGALADATAALPALEDALADALAEQTAAQTAVDAAQAALAAAEAELRAATAELTAARADQAAAQQAVDDLTAALAAVEQQIADAEAELLTLDPITDALRILELEALIAELEAEADQLESDLAAAEVTLADATAAVSAAETVVTSAETAVTAAETTLADATAELADATATVTAAQQALTSASAAVTAAEAALATAEGTLAAAQAAVTAARDTLAAAEAALGDAVEALDEVVATAADRLGAAADELTAEVDRLRTRLADLLDRVLARAGGLPDLATLLDRLHAALSDVWVVRLGDLRLDVSASADAERGTTEVTCGLGAVEILGQTLRTPSCVETARLIAGVPAAVTDLLSTLPLTGLPDPRIAGLTATRDASAAPDADGVTRARATVLGLAVSVPSVGLTGLSDALTAELDGLLGTALGVAGSFDASTGTFGQLRASDTGGRSTLARTSATDGSTLAGLRDDLDGLPTGQRLAGQRTLGIDLTAGFVAAEAVDGVATLAETDLGSPFDLMGDPLPGPGGTPDGETDDPEHAFSGPGAGTPGDGTPGAPADRVPGAPEGDDGTPSLPHTGGGLVLLPLALLGSAWALRRRTV